MLHRITIVLFLSIACAFAAEPTFLSLPDSKIILSVPEGWTVKDKNNEIGIYGPDQPEKGQQSKIHLSRYQESDTTLQAAIESEIDRISARSPKWGSSNDRRSYKGSAPIETQSGMNGIRADFYDDVAGTRRHSIVKYYFFDEAGKIFRVCSHVYGDEARFKEYEQVILGGLKFNETK